MDHGNSFGGAGEPVMRVLLVEEDPRFADSCARTLQRVPPGCRVTVAPDLHHAMGLLGRAGAWDLVLTDLDLEGGSGSLENVRAVAAARHPAPVVVLAAEASAQLENDVLQLGAQDVIDRRDVDDRSLGRAIRHAVDRSRLVRQLQLQCLCDPLTGLPNRQLWWDRCKIIFSGASRSAQQIAMLYLDVDGLKGINDRSGNAGGDQVLKSIGRTLSNVTRDSDTAARVSGDEFGIVAAVAGADEARRLVARVVGVLQGVSDASRRDMRFTVSVGVAVADPAAVPPDKVADRAEEAMLRAKTVSRGHVTWAETSGPAGRAPL